jgi:hypothetical protein
MSEKASVLSFILSLLVVAVLVFSPEKTHADTGKEVLGQQDLQRYFQKKGERLFSCKN